MKWILVFWFINPGHSQCVHIEKYQDVHACESRQTELLSGPRAVRATCSRV
jgi:hypothetical protein